MKTPECDSLSAIGNLTYSAQGNKQYIHFTVLRRLLWDVLHDQSHIVSGVDVGFLMRNEMGGMSVCINEDSQSATNVYLVERPSIPSLDKR